MFNYGIFMWDVGYYHHFITIEGHMLAGDVLIIIIIIYDASYRIFTIINNTFCDKVDKLIREYN